MKCVILALVTVLICAVNTADGIRCELSSGKISINTGEVTTYRKQEADCLPKYKCVIVMWTHTPPSAADTYYSASCVSNNPGPNFHGHPDFCTKMILEKKHETCSQKVCSENLCNAFSRNYSPTTEPPTTESPTTEPPTTEPPTTEPPTTEPPTTEPPTTEPPTTEPPTTEPPTTEPPTTDPPTTEPPTTEPPTTESPTTEPPTTESPTTEPPTTEPPTTVVETSTSTSPSSNCPFLNEAQTVDFNCSRFYDDLSKCGRRRAWSCDYSSWRLNVLDVFLKEVVDKIPEDSGFKLPKCDNDDGISCESSEKCCYTSYSGCQVCHCIDHDYKDQTYLQNIWKKDHRLWRKLNKFYIDFFSEESQYFDTC